MLFNLRLAYMPNIVRPLFAILPNRWCEVIMDLIHPVGVHPKVNRLRPLNKNSFSDIEEQVLIVLGDGIASKVWEVKDFSTYPKMYSEVRLGQLCDPKNVPYMASPVDQDFHLIQVILKNGLTPDDVNERERAMTIMTRYHSSWWYRLKYKNWVVEDNIRKMVTLTDQYRMQYPQPNLYVRNVHLAKKINNQPYTTEQIERDLLTESVVVRSILTKLRSHMLESENEERLVPMLFLTKEDEFENLIEELAPGKYINPI